MTAELNKQIEQGATVDTSDTLVGLGPTEIQIREE